MCWWCVIKKLGKKRQGKLEAFSDTLEKMMVSEKGFSDSYKRWNLYLNWKDIVGDVAFYSTPIGYYRGVLVISVDHAAYLQQLDFLKEDLKDKVNEFESNWVKDNCIEDYRTQSNCRHGSKKDWVQSIKLQLRGQ